jgi:hypothetical protein
MGEVKEEALSGGYQTVGVVRVGDTVRRPVHARSEYVHEVLRHLESVGFDGAPRLLGIDEQGREILSYLPGVVIVRTPNRLSDPQLRSAAELIRRFHDATAGTPVAEGGEVVCHTDLGPHNIVWVGENAVGLIDWDEDLAPGSRLVDFGHAVWCCADVCEPEVDVAEQARKVQLICDAYGWDNPAAVLDEIADRFRRARDEHAANGRANAVAVFEENVRWMEKNEATLKACL